MRTGGDRRNREFAGPHVKSTAAAAAEALAFDPQTSGGLLISLPADKSAVLEATFAAAGARPLPRGTVPSRDRASRCGALGQPPDRTLEPCASVPRRGAGALVSPARLRPARRGLRRSRCSSSSRPAPFVRLTASGLGCDNWPRCGRRRFPRRATSTRSSSSANRRGRARRDRPRRWSRGSRAARSHGLPRWVRRSRSAPLLGTLAQIPLGGITVILDLHPLAVMSHFLLALIVLAGPRRGRARGVGRPTPARVPAVGPRWLRHVVACDRSAALPPPSSSPGR